MSREPWQDKQHPYFEVMQTAMKNINAMTPEQAHALLKKRGRGGFRLNRSAQTRELTGGYWSQSLDSVIWREVGKRAGLIK